MTKSLHHLRVGTRSSRLALAQAKAALARLELALPSLAFELVEASSPGDRDRELDLQVSPDDFFTRDLDQTVLDGAIDAAIHSAKDVPPAVRDGLDWCWMTPAADRRDVLVLRPGESVADLPPHPRIGVSSARRESWCETHLPQAERLPIRGDIEARLAQLDGGQFDAILTAGCALQRLGLADRITQWIPLAELPTPEGQGMLAMTFRADDERLVRLRSLWVKPVVFVGAGVGQADFCTVAGVKALQQCDVCLHDTLMDPDLLVHLPRGARAIDVGKRAGAHSMPQYNTTQMLLDHARRGARVVRLKGGDPSIFGRLAEEIEALDHNRLPYRIIPGVSSLSVMGASTGILLTRRGLSTGFSVMTGRAERCVITAVDHDSRLRLPLVLFMAVSAWPELKAQLVADGVSEALPVALVLSAGTSRESVLRGSVGTIGAQCAEAVASSSSKPAGLIVVGEVARYGITRTWGALQGQRVLLTCSDALQSEAQRCVHDAGGLPVPLPLIELTPTAAARDAAAGAAGYDWLIVTSPSAVRCLLAGLHEGAGDVRELPRIMACGPGTLRELRAAGLQAAAVPEQGFGAEGIVALAKERIASGAKVLRVRSDKAGPSLAEALREQGLEVDDICIYHNTPVTPSELPPFDTAFFASSSAVNAFMALWGTDPLTDKTVLAIGQPTARALDTAGLTDLLISPEATVEDAIEHLATHCVNEALHVISRTA
ncbi:MAG: uroporphyrinogen-III C-methyltransferase [Lentisphaerae bacterium]|nr:uroporphyrinogen-III C-methyltransferase [Lentisphaerota bacterium]